MPSPLASVVFWAAVVCCAVAEVAIVRSAALARGAADAGAATRGETRLPSVRRGLEVTWALLPALALALVLAWTWREMQSRGAPDRPAPFSAPDAGRPSGAVP